MLQCIATHVHKACTNDLVLQMAERFQNYIISNFEEIYKDEGFPKKINIGPKQREINNEAEMRQIICSELFHLLWLDH